MLRLLEKLLAKRPKQELNKKQYCAFPWHYKPDGKFIERAVLSR